MTEYVVIYEDPLYPDDPAKVLVPASEWLKLAMSGELPPIWVYWQLQEDEERAIKENRHDSFTHDTEKLLLQFTAPRVGPLTEEEAITYLIMKDVPRRVWGKTHNKPMFAITTRNKLLKDSSFRNAWRLINE